MKDERKINVNNYEVYINLFLRKIDNTSLLKIKINKFPDIS